MRNFGWKKIRNFPAGKSKTSHVEDVMRFALTFKRKFPKFDILSSTKRNLGKKAQALKPFQDGYTDFQVEVMARYILLNCGNRVEISRNLGVKNLIVHPSS